MHKYLRIFLLTTFKNCSNLLENQGEPKQAFDFRSYICVLKLQTRFCLLITIGVDHMEVFKTKNIINTCKMNFSNVLCAQI